MSFLLRSLPPLLLLAPLVGCDRLEPLETLEEGSMTDAVEPPEPDGDQTTSDGGTETTSHPGTETTSHPGTETTSDGGTETTSHPGTETTADPVPPVETCEVPEAGRACTTETGEEGRQYCVPSSEDYRWGTCVANRICEPGEQRACCLPDDEECEAPEAYDTCILLDDGTPQWHDNIVDFEFSNCNTPLVLSFDGGAVQMQERATAAFDIDGTGACLTTDWPTTATPWLAIDLDEDGQVDSGRELFGSGTVLAGGRRASNGFHALAALDSDGNGRIDGTDDRFSELVLWYDHDGDKRGTLSELEPIEAHRILSIDLDYHVAPHCDARGNCEVERASFTFIDPTGNVARGEVIDIHLMCQ